MLKLDTDKQDRILDKLYDWSFWLGIAGCVVFAVVVMRRFLTP
jgi:hypothetical protein